MRIPAEPLPECWAGGRLAGRTGRLEVLRSCTLWNRAPGEDSGFHRSRLALLPAALEQDALTPSLEGCNSDVG